MVTIQSRHAALPTAVDVTHRVARTFSLAIRFLPASVRDDVYLLYLVCRSLDDLVDEGRPEAEARLHSVREWACAGGGSAGEEEDILHYLAGRYPSLPRDAVIAFCDAQLSSLQPPNFFTEDDLDHYAYGVAGTVGRLMGSILGISDPRADAAARALGIAMQRTNILRDLDEDLAEGRVYIPLQTLERCRVTDLIDGDREALLRWEITLAEQWYDIGMAGIHLLETGAWQVRAAATMYREILRQIERDGFGARRPHRAHVPPGRKAWLMTRAVMGR